MRSFKKHKWKRYKLLKSSNELRPHLPETKRFTKKKFIKLLEKHKDIIVKPNNGRRGRGVFRIKAIKNDRYLVHKEDQKVKLQGNEAVYDFIQKNKEDDLYVVQERVPLATRRRRIIDFRVIVQRKTVSSPWEVTAMVAKWGGKGYIVSNITRSNGKILMVEEAITKSTLKTYSHHKLSTKIKELCLKAAYKLADSYKEQRIFGFDVGVDNKGHIWILEANLDPMMSHFMYLDDQSMYNRIMYYKQYADQ